MWGKKNGKWSSSSQNRSQPASIIIPETLIHPQNRLSYSKVQNKQKNLEDALSHALRPAAGGSTGWSSAVLNSHYLLWEKGEEVKHVPLKDFT